MSFPFSPAEALDAAVRAVAPIYGVAILATGAVAEPGWYTVTRADGLVVRIDYTAGATAQQILDGEAAALTVDLTQSGLDNALTLEQRKLAKELIMLLKTPEGKALRVIMALLVDGESAELNELRKWLMDFKAAVNGAATLGALKTAVAALPNLPQRNMTQAKSVIVNKLNLGVVD